MLSIAYGKKICYATAKRKIQNVQSLVQLSKNFEQIVNKTKIHKEYTKGEKTGPPWKVSAERINVRRVKSNLNSNLDGH
jgi:hypothetical protein